MSRSSPRVSIGLPVYNGEQFLAEALKSLLGQTFEDIELIISDNASSDQTEEICRTFAEKDGRVRYFRNEKNIGISRNFNRTFQLAHGEFFKWAASDDLCEPEFVRRCLEILDREPQAVLAYSRSKLIDEKGRVLSLSDELELQDNSPVKRYRRLYRDLGLCNAQYGLVRSSALRRTGLMGTFIGSDICLLAELSLHGAFIVLPDHYFSRRFHSGCLSSDRDNVPRAQEFYDPERKGNLFLREWRHLFEHLRGMTRAPLGAMERLQVVLFLIQNGIWSRHKLLQELLLLVGFRLQKLPKQP